MVARAGSSALLRAAIRSDRGRDRHRTAHSTPASTGELLFGDGAAYTVIGSGNPIAVLRRIRQRRRGDFVDHFREAGHNGDYGWEERWCAKGLRQDRPPVVKRPGGGGLQKTEEIDHRLSMPSPLLRASQAVAKSSASSRTVADAVRSLWRYRRRHPLLMLAKTSPWRRTGPEDPAGPVWQRLRRAGTGNHRQARRPRPATLPG